MTSICWNGLNLELHPSWEARVQGLEHLVFEQDLQPLFELRWYAVKSKPNFQKECAKNGLNIKEIKAPAIFADLKHDLFCYRQKNDCNLSGCFIYLKKHNYIVHCHLTTTNPKRQLIILKNLLSLKLKNNDTWTIQNFAFNINNKWHLDNYSFLPGLTRLQFSYKKTKIHLCRLTEAKKRLTNSSEEDLLRELAGSPKMGIYNNDHKEFYGYSTPNIFKQLVIRLKRKMPFIEAQLKTDNNIIQALVIESISPINTEESKKIWQSYVIFK